MLSTTRWWPLETRVLVENWEHNMCHMEQTTVKWTVRQENQLCSPSLHAYGSKDEFKIEAFLRILGQSRESSRDYGGNQHKSNCGFWLKLVGRRFIYKCNMIFNRQVMHHPVVHNNMCCVKALCVLVFFFFVPSKLLSVLSYFCSFTFIQVIG